MPQLKNIFNILPLAILLGKWIKAIVVVIAVSGIAAFIFSGPAFIKPKFKSTAVVYPSNLIPYSSETSTEQLLQLFNSEDIRNGIIQKFDLAAHYGIDSSENAFRSILFNI